MSSLLPIRLLFDGKEGEIMANVCKQYALLTAHQLRYICKSNDCKCKLRTAWTKGNGLTSFKIRCKFMT